MKHHSRPSLFSPLWVSVATVSCHLEGPHPRLSFTHRILCLHNTELENEPFFCQCTFITKSTFHLFSSCINFHAVPNMFLLLLFCINSQYYAASQVYDYTHVILPNVHVHTHTHRHLQKRNHISFLDWLIFNSWYPGELIIFEKNFIDKDRLWTVWVSFPLCARVCVCVRVWTCVSVCACWPSACQVSGGQHLHGSLCVFSPYLPVFIFSISFSCFPSFTNCIF